MAPVNAKVHSIRFTQSTISRSFTKGPTVDSIITEIRNHKIAERPRLLRANQWLRVIRVVQPPDTDYYVTLDNRRLYVYRRSLAEDRNAEVVVIVVDFADVEEEYDRKNTTENDGSWPALV